MAIATHRDLAETRDQLTRWLTCRLPDATDIALGEVTMPPGAGFSNETLLVSASWKESGTPAGCDLVIRVEPSEHTLYFEAPQRFRRQTELLRKLSDSTDLPVANVRFVENDPGVLGSPFFAMDLVRGSTIPDFPAYNQEGWVHDATAQQQERLWWSTLERLIEIHTLDWQGLGLGPLLDDPARGATGTAQQLAYLDQFYDWAREGEDYPVLGQSARWLAEHLPAAEPLTLCWGDARLANVIYVDFTPAAVLDWDLATLGNPLQDLAWWLLVDEVQFGDRHTGDSDDPAGLPGFPSAQATLDRWSQDTGISADNLDYYLVLSGYKYAICAIRYVRLMNTAGMPPEMAAWADGMRLGAEKILARIVQA